MIENHYRIWYNRIRKGQGKVQKTRKGKKMLYYFYVRAESGEKFKVCDCGLDLGDTLYYDAPNAEIAEELLKEDIDESYYNELLKFGCIYYGLEYDE